MTKKEIKQFTKDMLKIVSQQSKKISANKKEIKKLSEMIKTILKQEIKGIESTEKHLKSQIENNSGKTCFVTLFLNEKNKHLSKIELDNKMKDFNNKINALMRNYGVEDVTAKMMKKI